MQSPDRVSLAGHRLWEKTTESVIDKDPEDKVKIESGRLIGPTQSNPSTDRSYPVER
jgi:hypothetical protein